LPGGRSYGARKPGSAAIRPSHACTPGKRQREQVETMAGTMAGYGIPQVDIARLITEDGIDPNHH